ncbi:MULTISPECIES: hypothetical protein [Mobiluncus]|uniref:Uncharacterized protein n=1 Tax=Mobiluncus holmesii ATCC 35242 TaxID=887899 RepID=E6M529_9ACTO|nr:MULTISPECIES: hypothetical protein [Mobiluncus]EFU81577.1 hypothetical protein HMPREF0576_1419 [Mobiluncus holmesii ATCC 35242]MCV0021320.1 hypothetical protein [Mobiluncus curtisii]STY89779.1 Uncharacterised protein [Mobiluncus holmesii]
MAATRYLVEGDRLDVLIGQVKRMGRRVTVLKAEKVRKGGLAGMFAKEHYEVLVEVEGVGEPPQSFRNATGTPAAAAAAASAKPKPIHKTLSEQADEAGWGQKKQAPPGAREPGDTAAVPAAKTVRDDDGAISPTKKDPGLEHLLDEARSQLSSNTEAAQAQLEAQMAQMGIGDAAALINDTKPESGIPAVAGEASAVTGAIGSLTRPASGAFDARLQGAAAPGATAGRIITSTPRVAPGPKLPAAALSELGFPAELFAGVPGGEKLAEAVANGTVDTSEMALNDVVAALPEPVPLLEKPGSTIVVVGSSPISLSIVETAQRLAGRLGQDAYCVLGGPKTTLPGEALRARSGEELKSLMEEHPGQTCVLALADSLIEAHRRTMAKLISVIYVDQTWAVVDARNPADKIESWIRGLPDAIRPDALAVQRIWESDHPGALFEVGIPIGMLDGVPARGEAWKMLLEDIFAGAH